MRRSSSRAAGLATETAARRGSAPTCSASSSTLLPPARPTTWKRSGKDSTTRRTLVPIEPVEPRIEMPLQALMEASSKTRNGPDGGPFTSYPV